MELDFSNFHPLDHRIGSRYCREVTNFPTAPKGWGNVKRHAALIWEYKWRGPYGHLDCATLPFRRVFLCRFGRHHPITGFTRSKEFEAEVQAMRARGEDVPFVTPPRRREVDDPRFVKHVSCRACRKDLL